MSKNPNFDAIIFDMGEVILQNGFKNRESLDGLEKDSIFKLLTDPKINTVWSKMELGELIFSENKHLLEEEYLKLYGKHIDIPENLNEWLIPDIHQGITNKIKQLNEIGYKIGLITNNVFNKSEISSLPIDTTYFHTVVESCKIGVRKPDAKIFEICLKNLGVKSSNRAIFLDDLPLNTKTAKNLGFKTITVRNIDDAIIELDSVLSVF